MLSFLGRFALVASLALPTLTAIPTVSVKGAKFFADGQQFFIKGVAYQGTPFDPLVDTSQCTADAASMASIGTNSIRVYHVDPTQDHDGCMSAFEAKGIYVWVDLDTFSTYILQTSPTWEQYQFANFTAVMDAFIKYDNLAGFWVGNEVINTASGSIAAPYIKAATADMKSYMASKNYRTVPIGYSAADIAELRPELQNYLACGSNYSQSIDFYGLNAYEWCGAATYETSGYTNLQAMAEGYSIPIFFSETGCNSGGERTFEDQAAIFGPNMVGTWSGSIIYEWVQETNDYGLVTYPNGLIYSGAPIPIQPDYDNLAGQWKNINPSGVAEDSYLPSFSAPACPGPTNGWVIDGNVPLPTLGSAAVQAEATSVKPPTSTSSSTSSSTSTTSTTIAHSSSTDVTSTSSSLDSASHTSLSTFPSTAHPASHIFAETLAINTLSDGSIPVSTMILIIPTDKKRMRYGTETTSFTTEQMRGISEVPYHLYPFTVTVMTTKTNKTISPSWVRLDSSIQIGSTSGTTSSHTTGTSSLTVADDSAAKTSSTPAASSSKGAGTKLAVPAGITGAVLGLFVMVFL